MSAWEEFKFSLLSQYPMFSTIVEVVSVPAVLPAIFSPTHYTTLPPEPSLLSPSGCMECCWTVPLLALGVGGGGQIESYYLSGVGASFPATATTTFCLLLPQLVPCSLPSLPYKPSPFPAVVYPPAFCALLFYNKLPTFPPAMPCMCLACSMQHAHHHASPFCCMPLSPCPVCVQ